MEGFLASVGLKLVDKLLGWLIDPIRDAFVRMRTRNLIRASSGRKVSLLVARIDGDNDAGSLRETVRETIRRELGNAVEITLWPEVLSIGDGHEYDAERGAYAKAQKWLAEKHCDLLVWGRVKGANVLSLRFTVAEIGSHDAQTFVLTETFDLPTDFIARLGTALAARLLLGAAPAIELSGRYLVPIMRMAAERLEPIVTHLSPAFDHDTRGSLLHGYALVRSTIGEQAGSNSDLEQAVNAYRDALREMTRERAPLQWATTQDNLGGALTTLGERESGTARLEQAAEAFRDALQERTRERVPLDWATTQNNLGNALKALGERESGTARLEQAVEAYRDALQEWTRERVPVRWATIENNLGNALGILGERESGTVRLEQAVEAFREALQERTRERVPLQWATTQNNRGNALTTLGERESGTARLEQAVEAYRDALSIFEPADASHYTEVTRRNLNRAEALLAERRVM